MRFSTGRGSLRVTMMRGFEVMSVSIAFLFCVRYEGASPGATAMDRKP